MSAQVPSFSKLQPWYAWVHQSVGETHTEALQPAAVLVVGARGKGGERGGATYALQKALGGHAALGQGSQAMRAGILQAHGVAAQGLRPPEEAVVFVKQGHLEGRKGSRIIRPISEGSRGCIK